jgi:glycosyltransferase involved in cell wall biosynthesis
LPNGIAPEEFAIERDETRENLQRTWPELAGSPYVLFLGRLHPKKRLDLLLEAFLSAAPRRFKLVVAGPDESNLWASLASRLLQGPDSERVLRVGMTGGREKIALLAGARLFALPSEHENFGVAALEALAVGTPVLLSPHVDLAGAVLSARLGHTAPLELAAWCERLESLLSEEDSPQEQIDRARQWVIENYSWDRLVSVLLERYRWVLAGCPAERPGTGAPFAETAIACNEVRMITPPRTRA